jgi:hypothetical protein
VDMRKLANAVLAHAGPNLILVQASSPHLVTSKLTLVEHQDGPTLRRAPKPESPTRIVAHRCAPLQNFVCVVGISLSDDRRAMIGYDLGPREGS